MNLSIGKMSLRTRLYLLTAMVLVAFLVAVISAVRTARTSDVFAQRQAATDVNRAARELAQEAGDYEAGRGDFERNKKLPPHLREIYSQYSDNFSRATAAALNRFEDVSGGFCTSDGGLKGEIFNQSFSAVDISQIANLCRELLTDDSAKTKRIDLAGTTIFITAIPFAAENEEFKNNSINGVFAAKQLAQSNIFADRFNLLTQLFLLISIIISVVFAFLTLRDWRNGMFKIESGLNKISSDLSSRIDEPKINELNKISREINNLARNLETNIERQKQLENDLVQNEKLAALGRVASGVAHEVRNPLASMKLKIQLAERNKSDQAKLDKTFDVLLEEIQRLDKLVRKLLDAGRPSKLNLLKVNLTDLILSRVALLDEKADSSGIKIENSVVAGLYLNADAEKLAQVIDNLLLNAIEAMPGGGNLKIAGDERDSKTFIEISDEGEGIASEVENRLFEPFFTTKDKGTGLGLAISREIIEAHGGKLYLAKSEKGAKFIIELPAQK